jgi:hypothetical protein
MEANHPHIQYGQSTWPNQEINTVKQPIPLSQAEKDEEDAVALFIASLAKEEALISASEKDHAYAMEIQLSSERGGLSLYKNHETKIGPTPPFLKEQPKEAPKPIPKQTIPPQVQPPQPQVQRQTSLPIQPSDGPYEIWVGNTICVHNISDSDIQSIRQAETRVVYASNMSYKSDRDAIARVFGTNAINRIYGPLRGDRGQPTGCVFVEYHSRDDALQAIRTLDKINVDGRTINVVAVQVVKSNATRVIKPETKPMSSNILPPPGFQPLPYYPTLKATAPSFVPNYAVKKDQ